jgi:ribosome maturation factor RimP
MITERQIIKLIESHLAGSEVFHVDVVVKPGNRISIFIDGDHGVTIEACRELNHFINENLDREKEDYDLTVSSAGADRPLKLPRQYRKNTGKSLEIITKTGEKYTGLVVSTSETGVELKIEPVKKTKKEQEIKIMTLLYSDIKAAKEVITFKQ